MTLQLPALAAAHGDARLLHVQAAAGLLFMLHLRLRHRGRAQGQGAVSAAGWHQMRQSLGPTGSCVPKGFNGIGSATSRQQAAHGSCTATGSARRAPRIVSSSRASRSAPLRCAPLIGLR